MPHNSLYVRISGQKGSNIRIVLFYFKSLRSGIVLAPKLLMIPPTQWKEKIGK
jgi:hypothetical protein